MGDKLFTFTAGAFFQNNNSILVPLTSYVKDAVFPAGISDELKPTHLVDTYCGSGLFGITLSEHFEKVAGVEIDPLSVAAAKKNAEINNLGDKTRWLCGKAEDIFGGLPAQGFSGEKSCVVIDVSEIVSYRADVQPPRKGCDELFLEQLIKFRPLTIVYVSCNVHTQARDVGWFMATATERGIKYELESLRGFDLFPQVSQSHGVELTSDCACRERCGVTTVGLGISTRSSGAWSRGSHSLCLDDPVLDVLFALDATTYSAANDHHEQDTEAYHPLDISAITHQDHSPWHSSTTSCA